MLRIFLAGFTMLLGLAHARAADCPLDDIDTVLEAPLNNLEKIEKDVSEAQSSEGGSWLIYKDDKGRVHTIIRIDYGEGGRSEIRLSVVDARTYGIERTRYGYIRHIFVQGPFAIAQRTTDYYFFCDGRVYLPAADGAMVDLETYAKDAAEAQTVIVGSPDVAEFTKDLAR